jgi:hypothetical protein
MSLQKSFSLAALFATILGSGITANAQKVYVTKKEKEATVKVYVTTMKDEADVIVFKTPFEENSIGNKGLWYFTTNMAVANKRIIYTTYKPSANLTVMYTSDPKQAKWVNKKKRYMME